MKPTSATFIPDEKRLSYTFVPRMVVIFALLHVIVDIIASQTMPVWPELGRQLSLRGPGIHWVIVLWLLTTSLMQVVFGYLSDRIRMKYLIWFAPLVAAAALSLVGLTNSVFVACLLIAVGGTATAAFHPEAVSMCGASMPTHRSRAISVFVMGGFLGQMAGPAYSGWIVHSWGIGGLSVGLIWALPGILVLRAFARRTADTPSQSIPTTPDATPSHHAPWLLLSSILSIQTLRTVSATGVPLTLAFLLDEQGSNTFQIGKFQSVFNGGIGFGGLVCAFLFKQRHEHSVLVWMPILGAVPLGMLAISTGWAMTAALAISALTVGIAMPIMISYGQQLVPTAERLASSMVMGASWGIGGCFATVLVGSMRHWTHPEYVYLVLAFCSALSGVLSLFLPKVSKET